MVLKAYWLTENSRFFDLLWKTDHPRSLSSMASSEKAYLCEQYGISLQVRRHIALSEKASRSPNSKTIDIMTIDNARGGINNNLTKNKPCFEGDFNILAKFPTPM